MRQGTFDMKAFLAQIEAEIARNARDPSVPVPAARLPDATVLRRAAHPEVAGRLPRFLRRRPQGGWARHGSPVRIRGFDLGEDVLAISLPPGTEMPVFRLEEDRGRRITTLLADGVTLARIYDAPEGIGLRHLRVTSCVG